MRMPFFSVHTSSESLSFLFLLHLPFEMLIGFCLLILLQLPHVALLIFLCLVQIALRRWGGGRGFSVQNKFMSPFEAIQGSWSTLQVFKMCSWVARGIACVTQWLQERHFKMQIFVNPFKSVCCSWPASPQEAACSTRCRASWWFLGRVHLVSRPSAAPVGRSWIARIPLTGLWGHYCPSSASSSSSL